MRPLTALPIIATKHPSVATATPRQPTLDALGWKDIGDELRTELRTKLAETPAWKRARVAFVVREDGVEVVERAELSQHYRRHGLRPLALRVRQSPLGLALVLLEGDEVCMLGVDAASWLAAEGT